MNRLLLLAAGLALINVPAKATLESLFQPTLTTKRVCTTPAWGVADSFFDQVEIDRNMLTFRYKRNLPVTGDTWKDVATIDLSKERDLKRVVIVNRVMLDVTQVDRVGIKIRNWHTIAPCSGQQEAGS